MNYRGIAFYLMLGIAMCVAMWLLFPDASAYSPRIVQGQEIYLNDTVDISGVTGWDNRNGDDSYLQYCGGFDCIDYSNPYLLKLPPRTRVPGSVSQYNYYIDPAVFGERTGEWYQFDELDEDSAKGNTLAFVVLPSFRNLTMTFPNGTVINQTEQTPESLDTTYQKPKILPERPVSDYLLAKGDELFVNTGEPAKVWIFGRVNAEYDYETLYENITFNKTITETLEPGSYFLAIQYKGKNLDYDVRYYEDKIQWKDGWNGIRDSPLFGVSPKVAKDRFVDVIENTDDEYKVLEMEVQQPSVTIEGFTEVPLYTNYSRYEEYRIEDGVVSLFDVRGYTNAIPGTNISVVLDESRHTPRDMRHYTFYTEAQRKYLGNMSYYQIYIPVVWDDMAVGMHTLTVRNSLGAEMLYDFPISVLPEDSFKPNATVKYAMDRNPWVPTPTPEVITTVVTREIVVEKTIQIPVTPSQEIVKKAQGDVIFGYLIMSVGGCLLAVLGYLGIRYIISVIKRARMKE